MIKRTMINGLQSNMKVKRKKEEIQQKQSEIIKMINEIESMYKNYLQLKQLSAVY